MGGAGGMGGWVDGGWVGGWVDGGCMGGEGWVEGWMGRCMGGEGWWVRGEGWVGGWVGMLSGIRIERQRIRCAHEENGAACAAVAYPQIRPNKSTKNDPSQLTPGAPAPLKLLWLHMLPVHFNK